jgi:hypothetical protein
VQDFTGKRLNALEKNRFSLFAQGVIIFEACYRKTNYWTGAFAPPATLR